MNWSVLLQLAVKANTFSGELQHGAGQIIILTQVVVVK